MGQYRYQFGFTTNKNVLKEMKYSGCSVVVYRPVCFLFESIAYDRSHRRNLLLINMKKARVDSQERL